MDMVMVMVKPEAHLTPYQVQDHTVTDQRIQLAPGWHSGRSGVYSTAFYDSCRVFVELARVPRYTLLNCRNHRYIDAPLNF